MAKKRNQKGNAAKRRETSSHQHPTPSFEEKHTLATLFRGRRYIEAAAMARTMTERFPHYGFGWMVLGTILYKQMGRFIDALAPMQQAAALLPGDAEVHCSLGHVLSALGRQEEAESGYRRALEIKPGLVEARYSLGLIQANLGRLDDAAASYRRVLKIQPNFAGAHYNLGNIMNGLGRLDDAVACYRRTLEIKPDLAEAHYNLGNALKDLGRMNDALASYDRALAIKPDFAGAHNNRGNALKELRRKDDAAASYIRALEIAPDYAAAHNNLGFVLKSLGRHDDAVASYRRALAIAPDYAEAYNNLGLALKELGRFDDAVASYRRALEIQPGAADVHNNLGNVLKDLGRFDEAVASYCRALEIKPDYAEAHNNLGIAFKDLGRFDDAVASYRRALEIKPDVADVHGNLGNALKDLGRLDDAAASYLMALEIKPDCIEMHRSLIQLKKVKVEDKNFAALVDFCDLNRNSRSPLPETELISLHFALGKCYDDIGDYDKAFTHFLEGCKKKRDTFDYSPERISEEFAEIMHIFDRDTIDALRGGGDPSSQPVFVLGMPRSGTTLIESIIAGHADVHGAGELPMLMNIMQRGNTRPGTSFLDNRLPLTREQLTAWGEEYIAGLKQLAPDARRITDKMPGNFLLVGLIHLMLPNAKIIHANRNPLDTCLSCFTQLFADGQEFTYDLSELGQYYAGYARMMAHWSSVLPAGAFLDVSYEDIVAGTEEQARRIVKYCGLEWDDACLDFHRKKRLIQTASSVQVRQPIYSSSIARWRHYERFLGPLQDAIGLHAQP